MQGNLKSRCSIFIPQCIGYKFKVNTGDSVYWDTPEMVTISDGTYKGKALLSEWAL